MNKFFANKECSITRRLSENQELSIGHEATLDHVKHHAESSTMLQQQLLRTLSLNLFDECSVFGHVPLCTLSLKIG